MKKILFCSIFSMMLLTGCNTTNERNAEVLERADYQLSQMLIALNSQEKPSMPRTTHDDKIRFSSLQDWTSGFFPGSLWYLAELTGDEKWAEEAAKQTERLESVQYLKWHHDIGFMMSSSYGNGLRFSADTSYIPIIIESAKSLSSRYRPEAGVIQSWNTTHGWQGKRGWDTPVIIDNMMNLELMFDATKLSGDSSFYKIATSHADKTLENHYRDDMSCYHVVDYDAQTGEVNSKETAQGYANESEWSRGQAWGLYGFVMCYRFTGDGRYLNRAEQIANYLINHPDMPDDQIPPWDFDAPLDKYNYRDVSAATIIASAMYELSEYSGEQYREYADEVMEALTSEKYFAKKDDNGNFLLKHSVGSIPHNAEIDKPLVYADYYFLEALYRQKNGMK